MPGRASPWTPTIAFFFLHIFLDILASLFFSVNLSINLFSPIKKKNPQSVPKILNYFLMFKMGRHHIKIWISSFSWKLGRSINMGLFYPHDLIVWSRAVAAAFTQALLSPGWHSANHSLYLLTLTFFKLLSSPHGIWVGVSGFKWSGKLHTMSTFSHPFLCLTIKHYERDLCLFCSLLYLQGLRSELRA